MARIKESRNNVPFFSSSDFSYFSSASPKVDTGRKVKCLSEVTPPVGLHVPQGSNSHVPIIDLSVNCGARQPYYYNN